MSFTDHFNYPMPSRADTMYLSTLKKEEPAYTKPSFAKNQSSNLNIADIEKARPHYQGYQYHNKETFANRNDDIQGSHPKKLHQPLEKVYYNLRNDDINGSKPQSHKFVTTRQATNPLTPDYVLPQVEIRPTTPPKFIRDNISINDIHGARPNPHTKYNVQTKTNNVDDIDGARPKKEWLPQGKQNTLDVRDINYFWEFHTKRQTDPQSPRYKVVDENNNLYEYGKLDNKCAVRHPKEVNKLTSLDLKTSDIKGAQANTSNEHVNKIATREQFMKTQDIFGAQATTLKKGITTGRQLDPLWPEYKNPGHSEPPPIYTRNTKPGMAATSMGFKTSSNPVTKSEVSNAPLAETVKTNPTIESFANQNPIDVQSLQNRKSGEGIAPIQAKERRPSGEKATVGFGEVRRNVVSPPSGNQTGLSTNVANNHGSRDEYVPARQLQKPEALESLIKGKQGVTLESKKAQNSSENYQKNVKGFYGLEEANDLYKYKTATERFDKFIK